MNVFVICELHPQPLCETHCAHPADDAGPRETLRLLRQHAAQYGVRLKFVALVRGNMADVVDWAAARNVRVMMSSDDTP